MPKSEVFSLLALLAAIVTWTAVFVAWSLS